MTRREMAEFIFEREVRRDKQGRIAIYKLPSNDGGGTFEVAGICDRYHPKKAAELAEMIKDGRYSEAEDHAIEYIANMTDDVIGWTTKDCIEFFLRDTCFNRGRTGCAKILQMSVGTVADGVIGSKTRAAIAKSEENIDAFINRLRKARENYEILKVGYRANLWAGLSARWDSVYKKAKDEMA